MIFTDKKVNISRQYEFDCLKALALLGMVIIHVYEERSAANVDVLPTGFLDNFIQFFGGPMAAPVFMTAMGVGIVYSSRKTPGRFIQRGLSLFLLGYLLNFCRDVIPHLILDHPFEAEDFFYNFFNVDILQFAGLTFIVTGILKKLKVPILALGTAAVLMQILGTWLAGLFDFEHILTRCFLGLIFYTGSESCFPFLNWYIYPVLGMLIAKYLCYVQDKDRFYKLFLGASTVCLIGFSAALYFAGCDPKNFYALADDIYYRQDFLHLIFCILVIFIELGITHFLFKKLVNTRFGRSVEFLSRNVNQIYITQWMLIGWSYLIFRICHLPNLSVILAIPFGILCLAASTGIVRLLRKLNTPRVKGRII